MPLHSGRIQALTLEFLPQDHTNLPLLPLVQGKCRPCECHSTHQRPHFTHVVGLKKLWHFFKHLVVFLQEKISCKTCIVDVQLSRYAQSPIFIHRSMSKILLRKGSTIRIVFPTHSLQMRRRQEVMWPPKSSDRFREHNLNFNLTSRIHFYQTARSSYKLYFTNIVQQYPHSSM